jgi:hypothetical protein
VPHFDTEEDQAIPLLVSVAVGEIPQSGELLFLQMDCVTRDGTGLVMDLSIRVAVPRDGAKRVGEALVRAAEAPSNVSDPAGRLN